MNSSGPAPPHFAHRHGVADLDAPRVPDSFGFLIGHQGFAQLVALMTAHPEQGKGARVARGGLLLQFGDLAILEFPQALAQLGPYFNGDHTPGHLQHLRSSTRRCGNDSNSGCRKGDTVSMPATARGSQRHEPRWVPRRRPLRIRPAGM